MDLDYRMWSKAIQTPEKATARYLLLTYFTSWKNETRRATRHHGVQGRGFDSPRGHLLFVFIPVLMIAFTRLYLDDVPVLSLLRIYINVMWQINLIGYCSGHFHFRKICNYKNKM